MVAMIGDKWKRSVSVGYWVNYVTSTVNLTNEPEFFKSKFWNTS